jgi:hypothetical protein
MRDGCAGRKRGIHEAPDIGRAHTIDNEPGDNGPRESKRPTDDGRPFDAEPGSSGNCGVLREDRDLGFLGQHDAQNFLEGQEMDTRT